MRVLVPWTDLDPDTAAFAATVGAELMYVGWCDEAYWGILRDAFARGETFVVVEHDVVPSPAQMVEVTSCSGEWCSVPVRVHSTVTALGLAFVKFDARLIAAHRDAIASIPEGSRSWTGLDGQVRAALAGARFHAHRGEAIHHHREPVAAGGMT